MRVWAGRVWAGRVWAGRVWAGRVWAGRVSSGSALTPAPAQVRVGDAVFASERVAQLAGPAPSVVVGSAVTVPAIVRVRISQVAGLAAGWSVEVGEGAWLVGSGPGCDVVVLEPGVASHQCVVTVDARGCVMVEDLAPRVATRVDGVEVDGRVALPEGSFMSCGWAVLRVERAGDADAGATVGMAVPVPVRPAGNGTRRWHRPPRQPILVGPPVEVPDLDAVAREAQSLAVISLLTMAGGAAVAWLVLGSVLPLVFGLVGVAGAVGTWADGRRRGRRTARLAHRRIAAALAGLTAAVGQQQAGDRRARWEAYPDLVEVTRRARSGDRRLWERRAGHPDAMHLVVGVGPVPWLARVTSVERARAGPVAALLQSTGVLERAPVLAVLAPGRVLGIAGPLDGARSVARSLVVQAAVHHGPADLAVARLVVRPPGTEVVHQGAAWEWLDGLPHCVSLGDDGEPLAAPLTLLVVDGAGLMTDRRSPARTALAGRRGPCAGIVLAPTVDQLPAACTDVIQLDPSGMGRWLGVAGVVGSFVAGGLSLDLAGAVASDLGRWEDPERPGAGLPDAVRLSELGDAAGVAAGWAAQGPDPRPAVVVGVAADGHVIIDLVADGPHALVAGTTGAGKSELLRTLVAGLAVRSSPEALSFVLIDFKGGSAFDACARLPHVVGVVTDLDEGLAERLVVSLQAELRRREAVLRAVGAVDLAAYRAAGPHPPLPRLVVVVDELASLVAEVPGFVDALVGIAQRGRSLGVHLVLATQRPAGVVSEAVRANTALRIALRVQSTADSVDVVGTSAAAALPRDRPGRALLRLGPSELVELQVAQADDLQALVDACIAAASALGVAEPHRPWCEPLPPVIEADSLAPGIVALADEPEHQCRSSVTWDRSLGHLVVAGGPGSGVTSALVAVARAAMVGRSVDALHVYGIGLDGWGAAALVGDPHVGALVGRHERERLARLVGRLLRLLDERRAGVMVASATTAEVVLLVDGLGPILNGLADAAGLTVLDGLHRVLVEGPSVGVVAALGVDRLGAIPSTVAPAVGTAWDLLGGARPGRAVERPSGRLLQLVKVSEVPPTGPSLRSCRGPAPIEVLPTVVDAALLPPAVSDRDGRWTLPLGIGVGHDGDEPAVVALTVHPGEHVLVAGPPRSGRTTALALIAAQAAVAGAHVVRVEGRSSSPVLDPLPDVARGPVVIVVDDADRLDDAEVMVGLRAALERPDTLVVAVVRADVARSLYGHWVNDVRRSRIGILLRPDLDLDGDLLGATLPRRSVTPLAIAGRGLVVADGTITLTQLAVAADG